MTGAPFAALVTLNSPSLVAGSFPDRLTAQPVALLSIWFAATGVNAGLLGLFALISNGPLSSILRLLIDGQALPAGGFEIAARSEPTKLPPASNTLLPMIWKNRLS